MMKMLVQYLAVGAAGCLGAMFRYFVGSTCGRFFGTDFPIGTFVINITGSLFLGWFAAVRGSPGCLPPGGAGGEWGSAGDLRRSSQPRAR